MAARREQRWGVAKRYLEDHWHAKAHKQSQQKRETLGAKLVPEGLTGQSSWENCFDPNTPFVL
jgi:hypothetical protein